MSRLKDNNNIIGHFLIGWLWSSPRHRADTLTFYCKNCLATMTSIITKAQQDNQEFTIKPKFYPHIGLPLTNKEKITKLISDENFVANHAFFPFIRKTLSVTRYRKKYDKQGNLLNNGKREKKKKIRHTFYASHLDAQIYGYYSHLLQQKYELAIQDTELNEVVTAYRKIPKITDRKKKSNKSNIDFANDVFNYIREHLDKQLVVIAFDIKGFFDNLDHNYLKRSWCHILGKDKLPNDHYNVFKSITRYCYVDEQALFNLFQNQMIVKTKTGIIKNKKVKKLSYLPYDRPKVVAFCKKSDIKKIRKKGLIKSDKFVVKDGQKQRRDFGICQGVSISSVLANIYMMDFDKHILSEVQKINGLYRRYSDDMVIVCEKEYKDSIIELFEKTIKDTQLTFNSEKTQVFHFSRTGDTVKCLQEFENTLNENSYKRNFEYLGFSFDGKHTYIKPSGLSKYYRNMKQGVKNNARYANYLGEKLFKRYLYNRYSHLGAKRERKYVRIDKNTNHYKETYARNRRNFLTYAYSKKR